MKADAPAFVLDCFAVLAYLQGEPGVKRVKALMRDARQGRSRVFLSSINLGEVLYIVEREKGLALAQIVLANVEQLPIEILPASRQAVLDAAHIKANRPLACADAFAVAAALDVQGTLLTGDPEFRSVEGLIRLEWLPGPADRSD